VGERVLVIGFNEIAHRNPRLAHVADASTGIDMSVRTLAFVGSLTRDTPFFEPAWGMGLSVYAFDETTGAMTLLSETSGVDNPTYLDIDSEKRLLCVSSEVYEWHEGVVTSYGIEPETGSLVYRNKQPTLGHLSAFVALDRSRQNVLVANYSMQPPEIVPGNGLVILPIRDGLIATASDSVLRKGAGPDAERQERSHAHCLLQTPDGRLVTADLGTDEVAFYDFEASSGKISAEPVENVRLPARSGPRHVAWSLDGHRLYVVNELASTVAYLRRAGPAGSFEVAQVLLTLPVGFDAENRAAGVAITPDERFLYASNRGHDSVMAFRIASDGRLEQVGAHASGGRIPRSFEIDPTGRFLVVANQGGDNLTILAIDPVKGSLSDTGLRYQTGSPMCVKIVRFAEG
jgi:6-phosphogluconolactonase